MCVYCLGLLAKGIAGVIRDPTFRIETEPASSCLQMAHHLSSWVSEHQDIALQFEKELVALLLSCMPQISPTSKGCKTSREKMWRAYHTLRTSDKYVLKWKEFLAYSGSSMSSIFCQHVGHYIFKELIKMCHPVSRISSQKKAFVPTYEELNGIRYAAGWVITSVRKKIDKSSNPLKEDLSICLSHLNC